MNLQRLDKFCHFQRNTEGTAKDLPGLKGHKASHQKRDTTQHQH